MNHFDNSNEIREAADFFGRVDDLEALASLAVSGQSVGVFGLRRAGKTSLLYRVAETLRDRGIESIYVQLNAMADADHFREYLVESAARLVSRLGGRVPENSEMLNKDFSILTSSEYVDDGFTRWMPYWIRLIQMWWYFSMRPISQMRNHLTSTRLTVMIGKR